MKLKTLCALVAAGGLGLAAASAQAAIVVDGWQFNTNPVIASNTANIGHLVVSGGSATVNQEVNALGNPFVGAHFNELGLTFSTQYIPESSPGANDAGFPTPFNGALAGLRITFTDLAGTISSIGAGGELNYLFTPGAGSVLVEGSTDGSTWSQLATMGVISPSGGDLNNFAGSTGTLGSSTLDLNILTAISGLFADSTGTAFDPADIFLEVTTTNKISSAATAPAACGANSGLTGLCSNLNITSEGAVNLLRVPEPATLGLLGIGLVGFAAARRRKANKA